MGSFEKLGILVIVVIIVMILAVAIYQWGETGVEPEMTSIPTLSDDPEPLIVDYPDRNETERKKSQAEQRSAKTKAAPAKMWSGDVPRVYTIKNRDIVWNLVVQNWRLKESFIDAIKVANPHVNMKRLKPGDTLTIPDPAGYFRDRKGSASKPLTREYEVQEGDSLEHIARNHLGSAKRWREIQQLNPGVDPKNLQLGQKLRIPVK